MSLSPLDDRYRSKVRHLTQYFSEEAYIHQKCEVELDYLRFLSKFIGLVEKVPENWDFDVKRIREIESKIHHDTKAIEVYLREKIHSIFSPWIHWGLTSWDIISLSSTRLLQQAIYAEMIEMKSLIDQLRSQGDQYKDFSMVGRTHGMIASVTTVGSVFSVTKYRLGVEMQELKHNLENLSVKFGGTVGHCDLHNIFIPHVNWPKEFEKWIEQTYQLKRSQETTQVDSYESWIRLMDSMRRISGILLDFSKNIWGYLSLGVFIQRVNEGEVGSSVMPHKVNPIHWENAEGNLSLAIGIWETISRKLMESRYQRDMSDSTVIRNMGVPFGHFHLALVQMVEGIRRIEPNKAFIENELEGHYEVLMEHLQHWLRMEGKPNGYDFIKLKTRGLQGMNRKEYQNIVEECSAYFQISVPDWILLLSPGNLRKTIKKRRELNSE